MLTKRVTKIKTYKCPRRRVIKWEPLCRGEISGNCVNATVVNFFGRAPGLHLHREEQERNRGAYVARSPCWSIKTDDWEIYREAALFWLVHSSSPELTRVVLCLFCAL